MSSPTDEQVQLPSVYDWVLMGEYISLYKSESITLPFTKIYQNNLFIHLFVAVENLQTYVSW